MNITDWLNHKTDHVWHTWINREAQQEHPYGGTPPPCDMPIKPHANHLYAFKSALQLLPWLGGRITAERRKELPMVHQQCSHSAPEPLPENYLMCALGQKLKECPILKRLRETFDEQRSRPNSFYASITDEQVDQVAATCTWHMLSESFAGKLIDWNEGAVQDCSDRRFWENVYQSLASQPELPTETGDKES